MIDIIKKFILENSIGYIDENLSFKDLTTFRIGGKIRLVYFPDSIENFIKFDKKMKEINEDYLVIGNGSNILASDNYYNKIVVSFKKLKVKYFIINDEFFLFPQLKVNEIVRKFIELGYCDIEYFSGIPGTIGGLLTMNASCFEKVISDYLIEALVVYDDEIKWLKKEELDFKVIIMSNAPKHRIEPFKSYLNVDACAFSLKPRKNKYCKCYMYMLS